MKSILAVLLVVGLASAAFPRLPSRGAISGVLKDVTQKLTEDVKKIYGHGKETAQLALQHVKEAAQAVTSKAPKASLELVKNNLQTTLNKITADGKGDYQAIAGHVKEALQAVQAALKPAPAPTAAPSS